MCETPPTTRAAWAEASRRWPGRRTTTDGACPGGAHHQANPSSDHEPDPHLNNYSCAIDLSHDPPHGVDTFVLGDLVKRDRRVKYVIRHNPAAGRDEIWNNEQGDRTWRDAHQHPPNKHDSHLHISLWHRMETLFDTGPWFGEQQPAPPPLPERVKPDMHFDIDSSVVSYYSSRQGAWLLLEDGGIITLEGKFYGTPYGKPYFEGRRGAQLRANPKWLKRRDHPYVVVAQTGEIYGTDGF